MKKSDYQELMNFTFKSSFISNLLTKLICKEITSEEFTKQITNKQNEISSKNKSLSEDQKYDLLMRANETIIDQTISSIEQNTPLHTKDEAKSEKPEKKEIAEIKNSLFQNFPLFYILIAFFFLSLSMYMTLINTQLGKPCLIKSESSSDVEHFKFLEESNQDNINIELKTEANDLKLNLNKHSILIMPKMQKVIVPTLEGILGFFIKYGLSVMNVFITIFGRFFEQKNIKWLKIRIAMIFTLLPFIRVIMLYRLNNYYIENYHNQDIEFYKSQELFQYNPKNLPYNIYNEISASLFSVFLGLNFALAYVVEAFYQKNTFSVDSIKKIFSFKNKVS